MGLMQHCHTPMKKHMLLQACMSAAVISNLAACMCTSYGIASQKILTIHIELLVEDTTFFGTIDHTRKSH